MRQRSFIGTRYCTGHVDYRYCTVPGTTGKRETCSNHGFVVATSMTHDHKEGFSPQESYRRPSTVVPVLVPYRYR